MNKLTINRETIRNLSNEDLKNVVGGGGPYRIPDSDDCGGGGGGGSGVLSCNCSAKTCGEPNCDSIGCPTILTCPGTC